VTRWVPIIPLMLIGLSGWMAAQTIPSQPIPKTYFGQEADELPAFPLQVPYGQWRSWDFAGAQWIFIETCKAKSGNPNDPCFRWIDLDLEMASLLAQGVNETFFTLSRSPLWAVNLASDPQRLHGKHCNYYHDRGSGGTPGQCLMPVDLNSDGSGANQIWKDWVTAIATHANDPGYRKTHTHIHMWEAWNEVDRSSILGTWTGTESFEGTYTQLVRMTEDLRCIVTGKGIIHNWPDAGQSTPCTAKAIDPEAVIATPSTGVESPLEIGANFLYCKHSPKPGSMCTTGMAGSRAVDVINYHLYASTTTPEQLVSKFLPKATALLKPVDMRKPLISGEGSWGTVTDRQNLWKDRYAQAGFVPRFYALYWSSHVTQSYWYAYNATNTGELFDGTKLLHPQSDAWIQTYNWLVGSTPDNATFCRVTGTVYTCDFTLANGQKAELVWDSQYGQNCSTMDVPIVCGNTLYTVPPVYRKGWVDLMGVGHAFENPVLIGANPILLKSD
jgi:hypothetical protein